MSPEGNKKIALDSHRSEWKRRPLQPWFPDIASIVLPFINNFQDTGDLVIVWDACFSKAITTDAFVVTSDTHVQVWRERQIEVRSKHPLTAKILEYKNLGDGVRWRALPDTLDAANGLRGLLLVLNIPDNLVLPDSVLEATIDHLKSIEVLKHDWKPKEFRKMFRVASTVAWLVARCSTEGQNVRFLSDEDNVWNNTSQQGDMQRMLGVFYAQAGPHKLGRRTWSTYCSKGRYSMSAEDLVAITDRAAGVVDFVASQTRKNGPSMIQFPQAKQGRECSKEERLSKWLWGNHNADLNRVVLMIEGDTLDSVKAKVLACSFN